MAAPTVSTKADPTASPMAELSVLMLAGETAVHLAERMAGRKEIRWAVPWDARLVD